VIEPTTKRRTTAARFDVVSSPFGRPTLLRVRIVPLGRDASIEVRQERRRGAVVVSLGEVAGMLIEREARKLADERTRARKARRRSR